MIFLKPFKYQKEVVNHFKKNSKLWKWFEDVATDSDELAKLKESLLKGTYRLDRDEEQEKYKLADRAAEILGLGGKVTLYQVQHSFATNASIIKLEDEYHIVFSGQLLNILDDQELQAIIGHELGHVLIQQESMGDYDIVSRILYAINQNQQSDEAYIETARIYSLYEEVYCDMASLKVSEDIDITISALIKATTGLHKVSAESYKKQSSEIFSKHTNTKSQGITHPEEFVRVRALMLSTSKSNDFEKQIEEMIESDIKLAQLSIASRQKFSNIIIDIIKLILKPQWIRTDDHIALAQRFYPNIDLVEDHKVDQDLVDSVKVLPSDIKKLISYILLDFSFMDKEIKDLSMGHCFRIAEILELKNEFDNVVMHESDISLKGLSKLKISTAKALNELIETEEESIYE